MVEYPHGLASGLLLLAFAGDELVKTYLRETPFSKIGPNLPANGEEMLRELKTVRTQRYAEVLNAREQGIGAVAVPVRGPDGEVSLALGCSAPLTRFDAPRRKLVRQALGKCARQMEIRTGALSSGTPV